MSKEYSADFDQHPFEDLTMHDLLIEDAQLRAAKLLKQALHPHTTDVVKPEKPDGDLE